MVYGDSGTGFRFKEKAVVLGQGYIAEVDDNEISISFLKSGFQPINRKIPISKISSVEHNKGGMLSASIIFRCDKDLLIDSDLKIGKVANSFSFKVNKNEIEFKLIIKITSRSKFIVLYEHLKEKIGNNPIKNSNPELDKSEGAESKIEIVLSRLESNKYKIWQLQDGIISTSLLALADNGKVIHFNKTGVVLKYLEIANVMGYSIKEIPGGTKGGLGSAVLGGLVFGAPGAIVGSNVGSKYTTISKISVYIKMRDFESSIYEIVFYKGELRTSSSFYSDVIKQVNEFLSTIDSLQLASNNDDINIGQSQEDVYEQLSKLKKLSDDGIINDSEYSEKKELLLKKIN
ncbi:SHOCT domain-containing protein [Mycoplasmatota bacterium zrk1]